MLESAQCMSRFSESVTRKGYKVVDTPMDGNCAFWAISNQTENCNHDELREKAVEYIQNLPQSEKCKMGEFLTESIHDYLFHMSQDGSYADHPILTAISNLLCVTIKIVHESTRDVVITPDAGSPTSPVIYLGYLPEMQHYVGLQPFNRFDPEDFVGVKLVKRSKAYMFLAKVVDIGGDDVKLRFMKATSDPNVYTWPDKTDVSCQPIEDVVMKLSQPTLTKGRGIKLRFNSNELNVCQQKM